MALLLFFFEISYTFYFTDSDSGSSSGSEPDAAKASVPVSAVKVYRNILKKTYGGILLIEMFCSLSLSLSLALVENFSHICCGRKTWTLRQI